MAKFAYRKIGTPPLIDATDLRLNERGRFYCTTPGCTATMHARDIQKACACFVSDSRNSHINPKVCLKKDNFKPDKYTEELFDLDALFEQMLHRGDNDRVIGVGPGGVGAHKRIPIRTIKTLYEMCLQYRGARYNGYDINDILVDEENFNDYSSGIIGNRIVCCTYYRYDRISQSVIMNCTKIGSAHIKIEVPDKEMFEKCIRKLYDPTHSNVVVIGGKWYRPDEENILATCMLNSVGKQICNG